MRIIYIFLFAIIITTFSCVGEYNSGKNHDLTTSHDYQTERPEDTKPLVKPNDLSIRSTWQKPTEILRRIGNLNGKVVADIGAGTGYFSVHFMTAPTEKVIAIEIDQSKLDTIQLNLNAATGLDEVTKNKLEPRLVSTDNPRLKDNEVDVVFISNTYPYIENKVDYLKVVKRGMKSKGRICIVDYKMKILPEVCPPVEERIPLYMVENQLKEAGFKHVYTDDQLLDFQYIVIAEKE